MTGTGDVPESSTKLKPLHPAYNVTNVNNKVRTLDGTKITYSTWVKLFRLHATAYKAMDHITDPPPEKNAPEYAEWKEVDSLVLQWIYSTVSDEIVVRIIENDTTARATWIKLRDMFLSNKSSRAAALEHEFTNLTLAKCSSIDEYCQKLKDLSEQLEDVDNPVSETHLVLQMVRGLPAEYEIVATFLNQTSPSWDEARNRL
ncbi:hypothetical protein OSB04_027642 [Centaurea solstitialis]|uniref:Uncharacterized protein n=1 Tax=Centaurea solstitialis TaxID=347529 RepID=A0AA38SR75_9ASTR|nr:hypothetical protein OSB04_027642 [Centaurea solstitialis]